MKNWQRYHHCSWYVGLAALFLLTSCSNDSLEQGIANSLENSPAQIFAVDEGSSLGITRALNSELKSFTLFVVDEYYDEDGPIAENVQETKDDAGKWTSKPFFYLLDDPQNAYGIAPKTTLENMSKVSITYDSQTFDYSVPATEQSKVKIASRLDFTKKGVNNKLMLTFRDALFSLQVQAVNEIKDVKIFVKGIKFHNVIPNGTFKFDKKKESKGAWTVDVDNRSTCIDYEQIMDEAVELSRTGYLPVVDSLFTLMPQDLYDNLWYPYDCEWAEEDMKESLSDANTNKHMYIEVMCQITQEKDGETLYLWGYAPDNDEGKEPYESVFFPYDEEACLSDWLMGINSVYYLEFNTLTGGYDETGQHITPHPTGGKGSSVFENAEPVPFKVGSNDAGNVDSWEIPDATEDIEIPMDGKD